MHLEIIMLRWISQTHTLRYHTVSPRRETQNINEEQNRNWMLGVREQDLSQRDTVSGDGGREGKETKKESR